MTDITRPRMVPTAMYPARVDAWLLLLVNQLFHKALPGLFFCNAWQVPGHRATLPVWLLFFHS